MESQLDAVALAESIERLARDVDLRGRMAARARERVRKRFIVDMAVKQTLRIYDSLPNNSG
jgi:glycosyltransferase involved in cell wall biosynthesis